jgi:hypothetical protein
VLLVVLAVVLAWMNPAQHETSAVPSWSTGQTTVLARNKDGRVPRNRGVRLERLTRSVIVSTVVLIGDTNLHWRNSHGNRTQSERSIQRGAE